MRIIRSLFTAISVGIFFIAGIAHATVPVNGENYVTMASPQGTETGKKVEVIEFFAYYCPHCNALEVPLSKWVKSQGDKIIFKRVQTSITGEPVAQQRLYYTLETLGKVDEYQDKIFAAIHTQHKRLGTDEEVLEFMIQQGWNRQKFLDTYNSFTVQTKVNRAVQMQANYQIRAWPTIVIDGLLLTSPPIAGSKMNPYEEVAAQDMMLDVMSGLVEQRYKERNK